MLLTQERETILSGGLGTGNNFTIAASPKAFEVLSSNLYQNKILAVIREITCNAADAHTEAGLPLSDIQIHLPSWSEPQFTVRDFGCGLSPEDVLSLYTTYFRSTKDNSNALIGGFGLGSKSPFAVADQFTITSWHGGIKNTYVCFKQDGLPRVNTVSSEPCGSETGLAVTVAAKTGDIGEWERQAKAFFCWWPTQPNFANAPKIESILRPSNINLQSANLINGIPEWALIKENFNWPRIMMGLVTYTLDISNVKGLPSDVSSLLCGGDIFLNMPIGSLAVSPSRESLSYDQSTCAILIDRATAIAREIVANVKQELADQPTLHEARQFVYENPQHSTISRLVRELATKGFITWRGNRIKQVASVNLEKGFSATPTVVHLAKRGHWKNFQRSTISHEMDHFLNDPQTTRFIWIDANVSAAKQYRKVIFNHTDSTNPRASWNLHLISGVPFDELQSVLLERGFPELINIADLDDPPKMDRTQAKPTTQGYEIEVRHTNGNRPYLEVTSTLNNKLDMAGGGVIVPCFQGSISSDIAIEMYRRAMRNKLIEPSHRYVGISSSRIKSSARLMQTYTKSGWKILDEDFLKDKLPAYKLQAYLINYAIGRHLTNINAHNVYGVNFLQEVYDRRYGLNYVPEALKFMSTYLSNMKHVDVYLHGSEIYDTTIAKVYGSDFTNQVNASASAFIEDMKTAMKNFYAARPMMRYVTWNSQTVFDIVNYLKA